jgi:aryl-alcohol dehydrogenase-like predicted oxidoreductase
MAEALELGITPWGVLGAGLLTGKYAGGKKPEDTRRAGWTANRLTEKNYAIAAEVDRVAAEVERSSSQVAIAWVRQKSRVVIPIIGARKHEQLLDNLKAADLTLSPSRCSASTRSARSSSASRTTSSAATRSARSPTARPFR